MQASTTSNEGAHRNKLKANAREAVAGISSGASIMVGGFGLCGNPEALITAVAELGLKDLTLISNNAGNLGKGLASWLRNGSVRKVILSYLGTNEELHQRMASGEIEVDVVPQGTFVERIRAGGAGIPAFYTPTGVGTVVAEGKDVRLFDGRKYLLESALCADFALVRAQNVDRFGNARFYRTARNFSPAMATAAKTTILEADNLVDVGAIDPDDVHLSGAFVKRIVHISEHEDAFEYRTTRKKA